MTVLRHPNNNGVTLSQWRKTAAGGETSLSGTDDFSAGLSYTVGAEQVFVNGVLIERGVDYTASTGTTVTGLTALVAGDIVTVSSPSSFQVANAIPKNTITAKGDLIVATGASTPANLAVGADGTTLVANSSASTGVSWAGPVQTAGKNSLINGNFDIWQRGTSISTSGSFPYASDRWAHNYGSAHTMSQQTTGVPAGSRYCLRVTTNTTGGVAYTGQVIETANVVPLQGQTVTVSIKVRRNSSFVGDLLLGINKSSTVDNAMSGSWNSVVSATATNANLPTGTGSANWFTVTSTFAVPNDGTANSLYIVLQPLSNQTSSGAYYEVAQAQLEIGSVATAFSRAGGTLQGELAACQRYYFREGYVGSGYEPFASGMCFSTTQALIASRLPFQMRNSPAVTYSSTASNFAVRSSSNTLIALTAIALDSYSPWEIFHKITVASGLTAGNATLLNVNGTNNPCYIEYNSEL